MSNYDWFCRQNARTQWFLLKWLKICAHLNYIVYKTTLKVHEEEARLFARTRCCFLCWDRRVFMRMYWEAPSIKTLLSLLCLKRRCLWVAGPRVWVLRLSAYLREARNVFPTVAFVSFSLLISWLVCFKEDFSWKLSQLSLSFSSTSSPPTLGQTPGLFCKDYILS